MRFEKRLGIGLLSMGLSACGLAGGLARAEDKPSGDPGRPAAPRADRDAPRFDPKRRLDFMQERYNELNLSAEQKTKIKAIFDQAKTDIDAALKASDGQDQPQRMDKVREIVGPMREKLDDVLDETQREKMREQRRALRGPGGGPDAAFGPPRGPDGPGGPEGPGRPRRDFGDREGRPGPDGPARDRDGRRGPEGRDGPRGPRGPMGMIHHLKDNVSKLNLNDEQKKNVDALLSETEKKLAELQAENEKMRGKFRETMDANRTRLDEILTDEQQQKLHDMMPPPRDGRGPDGDRPPRRDRGPRGEGRGGPGDGPDGPPPPPR